MTTDPRTDLGAVARHHGYEVDYSAYGHIVDTYTRPGHKVQVKLGASGRVLMTYINGQPMKAGRPAAIAAIINGAKGT
jgi:hypothetical protein